MFFEALTLKRIFQVAGPTEPSTSKSFTSWNCFTAESQAGPKEPSIFPL